MPTYTKQELIDDVLPALTVVETVAVNKKLYNLDDLYDGIVIYNAASFATTTSSYNLDDVASSIEGLSDTDIGDWGDETVNNDWGYGIAGFHPPRRSV